MGRPKTRADTNDETGPRGGVPQRRCLASGQVRPAAEMVRFVVGPDGVLHPDVAGRLPGRGLWLSAERDQIKRACTRNLFSRAARRPVTVPADLEAEVGRLLTRRCLDLLGMARRAGQAVAGFEKARGWLREGKGGLLFEAADGAADGRRRLQGLAPGIRVVDLFTASELGAALGREAAVHVVVRPGRLAERLLGETARLEGLRAASA